MISRRTTSAAALTLLALAACSSSATPHPAKAGGGVRSDPSLLTPYGAPIPTEAAGGGTSGTTGDVTADAAAPLAATEGKAYASGSGGTSGGTTGAADAGTGTQGLDLSTEQLRAGSVDDNAGFSAYERYRAGYAGPSRAISITGRHIVTVTDAKGQPLLGAQVADGAQKVLSHVDGRALLFGVGSADTVTVTYAGATATKPLDKDGATTVEVDTTRDTKGLTLDLQLMLDTTGSMGDEIDRLRTSLDSIAQRLDALPAHPAVRYGLTVYKDHEDSYVFRTGDFTDLATFRTELGRITAGGGGDTPEALDEAFHGAVNGPSWRGDEHSVEMILLVSDAPGHIPGDGGSGGFEPVPVPEGSGAVPPSQQSPSPSPTQADGVDYASDAVVAAERGIEVIPIAASGADDTAEYVFRQLAERTLGTFFFLTYAPDGSPGDGTTHHVGGYQTGDLDDLIVDHVSARLAAYAAPAGAAPVTQQ